MAKQTNMLYFYAAIIVLYGCYKVITRGKKRSTTPPKKKEFLSIEKAKEFVNQLSALGYYKYADANDIDSLKMDLVESISEYGVLSTLHDDETYTPKDYRYYHLNGETVFEKSGFANYLEDMKRLFDKIGLKLDVSNHFAESNAATGFNHELTVNGKRYVILHEFQENYGWGVAAKEFAELINDQLEIQNKDERLYLISGGNEGVAVFLTESQFQLIDKLFIDNEWKPLPIDRWSKRYRLEDY